MGLKKALSSSIGGKYLMALTGAGLFAFVIGHMLGNLQIYLGRDTLNSYAEGLKNMPALLWGARIGLLILFVAHIVFALKLTKRNREARPIAYHFKDNVQSTSASRFMMISGLTILAFVIYHLLHFTIGVTHPDDFALCEGGRHDVYSMAVKGFQSPLVSLFYIVCQLLLGWHLLHGSTSLFQSLGINHPYWSLKIQTVCRVLVLAVVVGNISIPVAVLTGVVDLPPGVS